MVTLVYVHYKLGSMVLVIDYAWLVSLYFGELFLLCYLNTKFSII